MPCLWIPCAGMQVPENPSATLADYALLHPVRISEDGGLTCFAEAQEGQRVTVLNAGPAPATSAFATPVHGSRSAGRFSSCVLLLAGCCVLLLLAFPGDRGHFVELEGERSRVCKTAWVPRKCVWRAR